MADDVTITTAVAKVLRAFLDDPQQHRFGYDLIKDTRLSSGSLYPILARLRKAGWLIAHWEDIDEAAEGRPARRFYTITPYGLSNARVGLAELHQQIWPAKDGVRLLRPKGGHA